jgi:hypothetical protein
MSGDAKKIPQKVVTGPFMEEMLETFAASEIGRFPG